MKVKVTIHEFYDREDEKYRKQNEIFEVKADRGKKLIGLGLVEKVKAQ